MNPFVPILFFFLIGIAFAVICVLGLKVLGPRTYNAAKLEPFECGVQATPQAEGGGRVPIKFYTTAMLFIIFDIEALFLFPFVVAFDQLGLFPLLAMCIFVATVFITLVYDWRRGGLEWD